MAMRSMKVASSLAVLQDTPRAASDTGRAQKTDPPPSLYMWHLDRMPGVQVMMENDTLPFNFQNTNLTGGVNGEYNHTGNLGSPRLSRIFSHRVTPESTTYFLEPFNSFVQRPEGLKFVNSNIPYTNLTYYKTGDKQTGEDRFKAYFSVNANKRTAIGFNFDYLYGRGYFTNQATAHFMSNVFGSYIGERYQVHAIYSNIYLKMNENGGITDDQYITKPENMAEGKKQYETSSIPVNMEYANSRNHNFYVYVNHRYNIGFTRRTVRVGDEVTTSIVHRERKSKRGAGVDSLSVDSLAVDSLAVGEVEGIAPADSLADDRAGVAPTTDGERQGPPPSPSERDDRRQGPPPSDREGEPPAMADHDGEPRDVDGPPEGPEGDDRFSEFASMVSPPKPPAQSDSIVTDEFVPVTAFIHSLKIERSRHSYRDQSETTEYDNTYYQEGYTSDSTTVLSVKNMFGISLLEGFNKYAKAGLTVYLSHEFSRYDLMGDTLGAARIRLNEQELWVGAELAKREGHALHYNLTGELGLLDKAAGQFRVTGNIDLNFPLGRRDTVQLQARGYITHTLPHFYLRHYRSNHFAWDNDLSKELRTRAEGELTISRWGTKLRVGVENVKNYTYLSSLGLPTQYTGSIQILDATLRQDFRLGVLHLDNEVTWQTSSEDDILPLPTLSLYHNLYLLGKLAHQVLTVQIGADMRYFTSYYGPTYTPALQHYNLQSEDDRVEVGGYPVVNVYANLHLKRTRIFVMMYHVNAGMGDRNYFFVPHYPLNGRLFKFGISWNFFD